MATFTNTINEQTSVAELVLAAQRGERAAFGELFTRYQGHVMAVAMRRLGDFADAQELCQDVFVQVIEKIKQLRQPECFGGWVRSITVRMAINRIVRRGPVLAIEPETLEATCMETQTPLSIALAGERGSQVHAGLRRLRAMDRETLEAFYMQGRTLAEMSDDFDAPLGTIKRRLHVARKRLAKEVEEPLLV